MFHVLVISGGYLDIPFAKEYIETLSYDKVFAVDKGLYYADQLGIKPDLIIGDFDTVSSDLVNLYDERIKAGELDARIIRFPREKDLTDSELAIIYSEDYGATNITMLGATGYRIDHLLANMDLLICSNDKGIDCVIVDTNNRICLIDGEKGPNERVIDREQQWGKYVSIIPVTPYIADVTLEGVAYPLSNARIPKGPALTVSNEIKEKTARFHVGEGTALSFLVFD